MMINLTMMALNQEHVDAGVVDLPPHQRETLVRLLTIDEETFQEAALESRVYQILSLLTWPLAEAVRNRAIGTLDAGNDIHALHVARQPLLHVLVGGYPPLMERLIPVLKRNECVCYHALSTRMIVEETTPEGA